MKRMRILGVLIVVTIGGALAAVVFWKPSHPPVALPAMASYDRLPPQFRRALQETRERVNANSSGLDALRKLARLYHANRLLAEAAACYRVIEARGIALSARDHYYLADLAQNQGDLERAMTELRRVTELEPTYLPAHVSLAEILFKTGREPAAATEYAAIQTLAPGHPPAVIGLARLALQRGDDPAAIALLEKLLAAHPESTSAAGLLAQILRRRGEAERADALAQWSSQKKEPVAADPWMAELFADCYDTQLLALKFEEYFFSGQMAEAVPFLQRVEELDPQSWLPPLLRGFSQARAQHHADAIAEYRAVLSKGGDAEKVLPLLVNSLLELNRVPEAVTIAGEYSAQHPESQPLLMAYADAVTRLGDDTKARPVLLRLLEKEPYLYNQNLALAKILWKTGERDEAAKCLRRIVQTFPNDVTSRGLLAQYYLEKAEPLAAIAPLEQALEQTAPAAPAHERLTAMLMTACFQVASAAEQKMQFDEAVKYYDRVIRLAPTEPAPLLGKANALVQLKQFARAAETLEKMGTLQPENPTIFLSLGDVLYQSGDQAQATRRWQQALQLIAPSDLELKRELNRRLNDPRSVEELK